MLVCMNPSIRQCVFHRNRKTFAGISYDIDIFIFSSSIRDTVEELPNVGLWPPKYATKITVQSSFIPYRVKGLTLAELQQLEVSADFLGSTFSTERMRREHVRHGPYGSPCHVHQYIVTTKYRRHKSDKTFSFAAKCSKAMTYVKQYAPKDGKMTIGQQLAGESQSPSQLASIVLAGLCFGTARKETSEYCIMYRRL